MSTEKGPAPPPTDSQGSDPGDQPPFIQINALLEPDLAIQKIAGTDQVFVINNFYHAFKAGIEVEGGIAAGHSVDALIQELYSRFDSNIREEIINRVLVERQANTVEEEEFMYLMDLRASMTVLSYYCLAIADIPPELKEEFHSLTPGEGIYSDSEHLTPGEASSALGQLRQWGKDNPKQNIPLKIDESIKEKIRSVCEKTNALINFYNANSEQLLQTNNSLSQTSSHDFLGIDRLEMLSGMFNAFGSEEDRDLIKSFVPPPKLLYIYPLTPEDQLRVDATKKRLKDLGFFE